MKDTHHQSPIYYTGVSVRAGGLSCECGRGMGVSFPALVLSRRLFCFTPI